jgi:hypothetical protein
MHRNSFVDRIFALFFDGEGGGGGIGDVSDIPMGESGDVSIMDRQDEKTDDDPADPPEETPEEGEEQETFDQVDEGEDGEEEVDENGDPKPKESEEEEFKGRPTLTDIKKKYPNIFKEFPDLREVLFRENELSKHFGSVEEAETASIKAGSFDAIEAALLAGDATPIINQLATNAPESLASVVDNFLPSILSKSPDLYLRATVPVIEQFMFSAYEHGKNTNDANLMKSMQHAANYFTGKPEIPNPSRRQKPAGPHPAEQKLEEERKSWAETRFKEASTEVSTAIDSELESEILKGFSVQGMTERQKSRFLEDVKAEIDLALGKDEAFKKSMGALWKRAASSNYPKDQRASIKSAFLARAKALVPGVRSRLRAEWFGDKGNSARVIGEKNKQGQQPLKKRVIPQSGAAAGNGPKRPPSAKDVDWTRTSDMDLIEGKFARRK